MPVINVPKIGEPLNFRPFSDHVLLERIQPGVTPGGLALPENTQEDVSKAKVVRCGPGRVTDFGFTIPMPVKEGDVVYMSFGGNVGVVRMGGKDYVLARARDLVAGVE